MTGKQDSTKQKKKLCRAIVLLGKIKYVGIKKAEQKKKKSFI